MKNLLFAVSLVLLMVSSAFSGTYTLEWDSTNERVDGYKVYTSRTPGPPYDPPIILDDATIYTTGNMSPGNNCFVVTAWLGDHDSDYSNEVCAVMPLRTPGNIRLRIN